MKQVAVIGGGISGLTAALELSRMPDVSVALIEASDRLGGVLETIRDGDYLVERSADNFATLIPDAYQLSKDFGVDDDLISPAANNRQAFVLNRGRPLPIPAGFSLMQPTRFGSIVTTRTLSWAAKLRLLGEYWIPRRDSLDDESLESFAVRRLGRETYEHLVEPIVSGIFTADPRTLSMQATMPQFVEMERRSGGLIRGHLTARKKDSVAAARRASGARYDQFLAPRGGMSSWIDALAEQLPAGCVRLNTPVHRIEIEPADSDDLPQPRWQLVVDSEVSKLPLFDAVVCATPAGIAARQLEQSLPKVASLLDSVPYASSAVVAMIVNRSDLTQRMDGFGLIVPRKEKHESLAISYTSNKYPGRVPDDEILLRIFFGGALNPVLVSHPDEELFELAQKELTSLLGWKATKANWQSVIRWREAMPQYLLGHTQRVAEINQQLARFPTLKLCGAAYTGVGIPQCVRSARQACRQLNELWNPQLPKPAKAG